MPWCDRCSRYLTPTATGGTGRCPGCGTAVVPVDPPRAPWHFKLLVGATAAYLGWRAVQAVLWLAARL